MVDKIDFRQPHQHGFSLAHLKADSDAAADDDAAKPAPAEMMIKIINMNLQRIVSFCSPFDRENFYEKEIFLDRPFRKAFQTEMIRNQSNYG